METKRKICDKCGKPFTYNVNIVLGREFCAKTTCNDCLTKEKKVEEEQRAKQRAYELRKQWDATCPPTYHRTDKSKLNQDLLKQVMAWQFNERGLVMHGPTGTGKTRMAFMLMQRLHAEGRTVEIFYGNDFAHKCAKKFLNGEGEDWIASVAKKDVVFFDDLGKFKLTERVEAELFGLIEIRTAWLRPMIVTANFNGSELANKMTADRGEPMIRRLREFCNSINF